MGILQSFEFVVSLFLFIFCRDVDQFHNLFNGIVELASLHCLDKAVFFFKSGIYGIQELFVGQLLLLDHDAIALFLEGGGIQDLIAAACLSGKRDQDVWLTKGKDLADGIGSCLLYTSPSPRDA